MLPRSKQTQESLNAELESLINVNPDEPVPEWHKDAACRYFSGEQADRLFFPTDTKDPDASARRSVCFSCPVRSECENWGNIVSPRFGCYGGFNERERRLRVRGTA